MEYNPYASELIEAEADFDRVNKNKQDLSAQLDWFWKFRPNKMRDNIKEEEGLIVASRNRLKGFKRSIDLLNGKIEQLENEAGLGLDPRYWFSSVRAVAKMQLAVAKQEAVSLHGECERLTAYIRAKDSFVGQVEADIARYRIFDELLAQATIRGLQVELVQLELRISKLLMQKSDLDTKLQAPLQRLAQLEKNKIEQDYEITKAELLESQLGNAQTGRDRAQIHAACEREFGEGKPARVIRERQRNLRKIAADMDKITARINHIVKCALRNVRVIVIDGNNLCYQDGVFIRTAALEVLVPLLVMKYEVKLVFDAGIRGLLGIKDKNIRDIFSGAKLVHVVASKNKADETLLDVVGDDPNTFVLSNDRFAEFPDKSAVAQGRMIRHEIVDGMIHVHDLSIEAELCR